jgi:hypothetical protein
MMQSKEAIWRDFAVYPWKYDDSIEEIRHGGIA